jgi:hypothetical protein
MMVRGLRVNVRIGGDRPAKRAFNMQGMSVLVREAAS